MTRHVEDTWRINIRWNCFFYTNTKATDRIYNTVACQKYTRYILYTLFQRFHYRNENVLVNCPLYIIQVVKSTCGVLSYFVTTKYFLIRAPPFCIIFFLKPHVKLIVPSLIIDLQNWVCYYGDRADKPDRLIVSYLLTANSLYKVQNFWRTFFNNLFDQSISFTKSMWRHILIILSDRKIDISSFGHIQNIALFCRKIFKDSSFLIVKSFPQYENSVFRQNSFCRKNSIIKHHWSTTTQRFFLSKCSKGFDSGAWGSESEDH